MTPAIVISSRMSGSGRFDLRMRRMACCTICEKGRVCAASSAGGACTSAAPMLLSAYTCDRAGCVCGCGGVCAG